MKFCTHCGSQISDYATICEHCGCPTKEITVHTANTPEDIPSVGLNFLSLLVPLIGLILFCAMFNKYPLKAKSLGMWSLFGWIINIIILIVAIMS